MKEKDPAVAIIVLNWNNYSDTQECLRSLRTIQYPRYSVVLIDNGSTDGSLELLDKEFPECHTLALSTNEGFARGNNAGLRYAQKKEYSFCLVLNNDTLVTQDFLEPLVQAAEKEEKAGIFAPKLLNARNPGLIDSTGHVFKFGVLCDRGFGEQDKGQFDRKTTVIGACGAGALYRTRMLEEIGLFDESFVTQYEDAELSWRAHKSGWKARFVPASIIYHKRGSTKQKDRNLMHRLETVNLLNNMTAAVKRHGTAGQKTLYALSLLKNGLWHSARRGGSHRPNLYLRSFRQLILTPPEKENP